nr:plant natriuretic peptide A [Stellera chamaejasme]
MGVGVIAVLCLCCTIFISAAHATEGTAVYYKPPYTPSACYGMQDKGAMVAGVSDALWRNGAACGTRYRVSCIAGANPDPDPCKWGQTVEVTVVDYCRPTCFGILNLSQDAFSAIANTRAGKVEVRFDQV